MNGNIQKNIQSLLGTPNSDFDAVNGINLKFVEDLETGSKFVIQNTGKWKEPEEIVVKTIREKESDTLSTILEKKYIVTTECEKILEICYAFFSVRCDNYEIYKNWAYYFQKYDKIAIKNKEKILQLERYLDTYETFQKSFKKKYPEKLI